MAQLDASLILAGRPLDVVGAMRQGNAAAMETNQIQQQNALANVYQTQGAGLLAGDQGAFNALAGIAPDQAFNMRGAQQDFAMNNRKMELLNAEEKRQIAAAAAQMDAAQKEATIAEIEGAVKMGLAIKSPEQWDAMMAQNAPELVGQFGNRQALAMKYMSMAEALKASTPEVTKPADEYQRYVQEETAAGRQPLDRIGFSQALKGKGFEVMLPDGTRVSQGGAQGSGNMVGDAYNPGEIDNALGMIDSIIGNPDLNIPEDPSLERVVGPLVGGGGNNIDDLNMLQRGYYGGDGTALVEKIGQLQNVAWLSARAMLKGGGAITDYESRKAEGAVARLSRAKAPDEFRAAAKELRDAIAEGKAKLDAARGGATQQPAPQVPSAPANIPPGAVDLLRQNPTSEYRQSFDEIFGQGAAAQILGGN